VGGGECRERRRIAAHQPVPPAVAFSPTGKCGVEYFSGDIPPLGATPGDVRPLGEAGTPPPARARPGPSPSPPTGSPWFAPVIQTSPEKGGTKIVPCACWSLSTFLG